MALRALPLNNLNSGGLVSSLVGGAQGSLYGSLDKRQVGQVGSGTVSALTTAYEAVSIGKSISGAISDAIGVRSPYYVIGEISSSDTDKSILGGIANDFTGGLVRAISKTTDQEGVIIDCLGDMDGTWGVDFTQNPIFYGSNTATDSRVRKPAELTAVVAISNYLSDNILASTITGASEALLGSLGTSIANAALYQGNTRAQQGLYKLIWLMENAKPFTVYTPHGTYESMLIKNIRVQTNDKTMDMLYATLTFQEVIMARPYYTGDQAVNMPARVPVEPTTDSLLSKKAWTVFGQQIL